MLKILILAASTLLAVAPPVAAQDRLMPSGAEGDDADESRDRVVEREEPYAERGDAWHRRRTPRGPGFRIDLGAGRSLRVTCGDTDLADCVDGSRALLDAVLAAPPMPPPPPPYPMGSGALMLPVPLGGMPLAAPPPSPATPPPPVESFSKDESKDDGTPPSPAGDTTPPAPPQPAG